MEDMNKNCPVVDTVTEMTAVVERGSGVAIILGGRAADIMAQIIALEGQKPENVFLIDMIRDLGDIVGMPEPAQMGLISDMLQSLTLDRPMESMEQWTGRLRREIAASDVGRMLEPPMMPAYALKDRHDGATPRSIKESRRAQRRQHGRTGKNKR